MMISSHIRRISAGRGTVIVRHASGLPLDARQKRLYPQVEQELTDEGFPILKLMPSNKRMFDQRPKLVRRRKVLSLKPREEYMKEDQDWPSIWPTPKTFSPSGVPLCLKQSYETKKTNVSRGKYANTELLKCPNFLHLTPIAVERHCKALRRFCTTWPDGLNTDEQVRSHFPLTYISTDWLHSSPNIRDPRARIVKIVVNISDLKLNPKDEDKLIRLSQDRYDKNTGLLTITASDCPVRVQNNDYAEYLLTALYFESIKHQKWEEDKPEEDWERFFWDKSKSKDKMKELFKKIDNNVMEDEIENGAGIVKEYKEAVEKVFMEENYENLEAYRHGVEKVLGLEMSK